MPIRPENKERYPKDWKLRSRFVRFYRAKNGCEWCGAVNGSALKMRCCADPAITDADTRHCATCGKRVPVVVLTTAHVHDDRPENSSLLNLAALCQRCHLRHDAKAHRRHRRERLRRQSGQMEFVL